MITLTAMSRLYGNTGQYIAQITGRNSKYTFERAFCGKKDGRDSNAYVDDPGLYETVDIDKKGRKDASYVLIIARTAAYPPLNDTGDPELMKFWASEADAAIIAKRLDGGETLADMIEPYLEGDKYSYRLRTKAQAKKASAALTLDAAITACWDVLQSLPEREAKQVLAALKARISPPKPAAPPAVEPAAAEVAVPSDGE